MDFSSKILDDLENFCTSFVMDAATLTSEEAETIQAQAILHKRFHFRFERHIVARTLVVIHMTRTVPGNRFWVKGFIELFPASEQTA